MINTHTNEVFVTVRASCFGVRFGAGFVAPLYLAIIKSLKIAVFVLVYTIIISVCIV